MKVVMGPVNVAGQPHQLVRGLRAKGLDARLLQCQYVQGSPFKYATDEKIILDRERRTDDQFDVVRRCLDEGVDTFHFWMRSFVYGAPYAQDMGADLPLYRQYGRRVVYRFTGFDLRTKAEHMARNPYHPWRYGYDLAYNEEKQRRYIDFVRENADLLIVQDPEMHEFCPEATVIPRVLDLNDFAYVGVEPTDRPLVLHAPSKEAVKGTRFVRQAVQALRDENLSFDYREVSGLPNDQAVALYRHADIVVDQLHIGWYGVLAMEAMALGKPVICYVRDDLAPRDLPIINANPDTITDVLRDTIKDSERRIEAGKAGRSYVERIHEVGKVTDALLRAYDDLPDRQSIFQTSYPTLEYLRVQHRATFNDLRYLRSRVCNLEACVAGNAPGLRQRALARLRSMPGRANRLRAVSMRILGRWRRIFGRLINRLA